MIIRNFFSLIVVIGLSYSCSDSPKEEVQDAVIVEEKAFTSATLAKEITELETELNHANSTNGENLRVQLIEFYSSFAKNFSNDPMAPDYLFKAGNECVNLKQYNNAIGYYDRIDKHYSTYLKRPESLFIQGFIYDSYKNEYGKAKEKYQRLIKLYPNHLLAEQAKQSISNMGLTDEEIIRKFEAKNQ